jgi:hypothetical protein
MKRWLKRVNNIFKKMEITKKQIKLKLLGGGNEE